MIYNTLVCIFLVINSIYLFCTCYPFLINKTHTSVNAVFKMHIWLADLFNIEIPLNEDTMLLFYCDRILKGWRIHFGSWFQRFLPMVLVLASLLWACGKEGNVVDLWWQTREMNSPGTRVLCKSMSQCPLSSHYALPPNGSSSSCELIIKWIHQ